VWSRQALLWTLQRPGQLSQALLPTVPLQSALPEQVRRMTAH
jgi:hypothetical protein